MFGWSSRSGHVDAGSSVPDAAWSSGRTSTAGSDAGYRVVDSVESGGAGAKSARHARVSALPRPWHDIWRRSTPAKRRARATRARHPAAPVTIATSAASEPYGFGQREESHVNSTDGRSSWRSTSTSRSPTSIGILGSAVSGAIEHPEPDDRQSAGVALPRRIVSDGTPFPVVLLSVVHPEVCEGAETPYGPLYSGPFENRVSALARRPIGVEPPARARWPVGAGRALLGVVRAQGRFRGLATGEFTVRLGPSGPREQWAGEAGCGRLAYCLARVLRWPAIGDDTRRRQSGSSGKEIQSCQRPRSSRAIRWYFPGRRECTE